MLRIDYRDSQPIYEQIASGFERMILCGALAPDSQMPSVRQLAVEMSINPNTIQKAYGELERRGLIYSVKGRGSFISPDSGQVREKRLKEIEMQIRSLAEKARELGANTALLTAWVKEEKEGNA